MKEELIISGRNIPNIDPYLEIWHWHIPLYLFLGGLAAGLLFFAALYHIMGKEKEMPTTVKWATFLAAPALIIGLLLPGWVGVFSIIECYPEFVADDRRPGMHRVQSVC